MPSRLRVSRSSLVHHVVHEALQPIPEPERLYPQPLVLNVVVGPQHPHALPVCRQRLLEREEHARILGDMGLDPEDRESAEHRYELLVPAVLLGDLGELHGALAAEPAARDVGVDLTLC